VKVTIKIKQKILKYDCKCNLREKQGYKISSDDFIRIVTQMFDTVNPWFRVEDNKDQH